jgi:hypothetical protein
MLLAPTASDTEFVVVDDEAAPFTVQVVGAVPLTVYATLIVDAVVLVLFGGEVIATVGATPRLTVTDLLSLPYVLEQATVIVFGPLDSGTELVDGVVEVTPLTVQVVGAVPVTE